MLGSLARTFRVPRPPGFRILAMLGLGVLLALSSVVTMLRAARTDAPGKLVALNPELTWRHREPPNATSASVAVDEASAVFVLENVGGRPVRVVGVEASCTCARPQVKPSTIAPNQKCVVEVRSVAFPVGDRVAVVKLSTDSPTTPNIGLRLRMLGWRAPPFLSRAAGDLVYAGGEFPADDREIYVYTSEKYGSTPTPPAVTSDLPFLDIGPPKIDESPDPDLTAVARTYRYKVTLSSAVRPPPAEFRGDVSIADPWDPQRVERIPVRREALADLRVYPSRIVLHDNPAILADGSVATFSVFSRGPGSTVSAVVEPEGAAPVLIRHKEKHNDGPTSLSIFLAPGKQLQKGEFKIVIRQSNDSNSRVVVSVLVTDGVPR